METSSPIIELNNISKRFLSLQALDQVSFDLREGETHALIGENGAGKSTLMRILAGIYNEYDGEYLLRGQRIHLQSPRDALNRGIGMIHQELSVMAELSVAENVFLGRQLKNRFGAIGWKQMNQIADEELVKLGFNDIDVQKPLGMYPLGMQQVVEVLRVILSGAQVLIMDEPTSALSPLEVERLIRLVAALRESNRSIIYISHFLDEVMRVADRITVLRDGQKVATLEKESTHVNELISLMLGHPVEAAAPSAAAESVKTDTKPLLEIRNLTADIYKDISLSVHHGEIVGLYGAIGAGHFDLARTLFGMYRFDSGTITLDDVVFPRNFSASYAIQHGIAYATESRRKSLFMDLPIYRNVMMPHLKQLGMLAPGQKRELEAALPALSRVNVQPPDPLNPVGALSGGNQQKVVIARWLAYPPKVFVMSEPTRGMDVGAKGEVMNILREFRDQGFGILVASSEPETVLAVADRIIVMARGDIVAEMANVNLNKDVLMRLL